MLKRFSKYICQSVAAMIGQSVYILADTFFISFRVFSLTNSRDAQMSIPSYACENRFLKGVVRWILRGSAAVTCSLSCPITDCGIRSFRFPPVFHVKHLFVLLPTARLLPTNR